LHEPTATPPASRAAGTQPIDTNLGVSRPISSCSSTRAPGRAPNCDARVPTPPWPRVCTWARRRRVFRGSEGAGQRPVSEGSTSRLEHFCGRCVYLGLCASFLRRSLALYTQNYNFHHCTCKKCVLKVFQKHSNSIRKKIDFSAGKLKCIDSYQWT